MKRPDLYDHEQIRQQLKFQKEHTWDIDKDIDWQRSIDLRSYFLPLDEEAISFPGANPEQRLVLSQLMGLIVNATIAEMEEVANKIRHIAWRNVLDEYPVNPEMIALGEQFFLEEAKHSLLFKRYNDLFCEHIGIDPKDLSTIIPQAYGAVFQKAIKRNAERGGHAFWWVVAVVEEVSLLIYQNLYRHRKEIDPLYFQVHKRHFEEESKHTNYAFMMLDLIQQKGGSIRSRIHKRIDLIYSELFSTAWVLTELHKVRRVQNLRDKHPFFAILSSCIPLMDRMSKKELLSRLFVSAPYISLILNKNYHRYSLEFAKAHRAFSFQYPKPQPAKTNASKPLESYTAADVWDVS